MKNFDVHNHTVASGHAYNSMEMCEAAAAKEYIMQYRTCSYNARHLQTNVSLQTFKSLTVMPMD